MCLCARMFGRGRRCSDVVQLFLLALVSSSVFCLPHSFCRRALLVHRRLRGDHDEQQRQATVAIPSERAGRGAPPGEAHALCTKRRRHRGATERYRACVLEAAAATEAAAWGGVRPSQRCGIWRGLEWPGNRLTPFFISA